MRQRMSIQIGGWLLALLGLFVVNVEVAAKAYTAEAPLCFADSVLMDTLVANNEIEEENLQNMAAMDSTINAISYVTEIDSLAMNNGLDEFVADSIRVKPKFKPDPQRALWLSLVFPGAGQIYNRKYWKLPIIYGGFMGCTYALLWNQQMYMDYSQAYLDIMDDDPNTKSYMEMLPPRYDITGREEQFKKVFKNKKNYYRRYRDLSAFCFVGVYLLSVIDAYVDAHLSDFDISPDLSMKVEPALINSEGPTRRTSYGVGCSLKF